MQFKHPEILYALLLLIIPILVHLFQLQRFVKVPFTNVKILKTIQKQTRKSARLKKWLILATRLLIFTCLIIAFAQPYIAKYATNQNFKTTIYLDNSFSMQAKNENGELLKSAIQKIIENNTNPNSKITLITNNESFENLDAKNLKNKLLKIKYYPNKLDLNTVLLKINNLNSSESNTLYNNVLISDFQNINKINKLDFTNVNPQINFVKLTPKNIGNSFIDSVSIDEKKITEITIKVYIKNTKISTLSIPVSLYNKATLIGKTTAKFNNSNATIVTFTIPNSTNFNGKVSLIDTGLEFDNDFYFLISKPEKINVLNIGNSSEFLAKIYTKKEFNFNSTSLQNLNYSKLQNKHLILLNELTNIPNALINSLLEFLNNGGNLVIIPSRKIALDSYNLLLNKLNVGNIRPKIERDHKITSINYEHPLIKNVFEKRVSNFQYPTTYIHYPTNFKNSSSIIKLDNTQSFISSIKTKNSTIYWVSSPLNLEASNFTQSPLVVPVFYNFAKNSLRTSPLYYTIKTNNTLEVITSIGKDNVLKISNKTNTIIPLQTISQNKVTLQLQENILQSGFYTISNKNTVIKTIAFNYNREESYLNAVNLEALIENSKNVTIAPSISTIFNKINTQQKINWLFKWFLAFSMLFLLIEMLILKYFNK
ncbi:BatA domain-containing protein [Lutibacter sp.]